MLRWELKTFQQLSSFELYEVMRLRGEIFVVEQNCPFVDADGRDIPSHHLCGYRQNELVAYARIVPPEVCYSEPSIGRVLTAAKYRKLGYGKQLMQQAINVTESLHGNIPIRIGAQYYLKRFYEEFGFQDVNDYYVEDGIAHLVMLRPSFIPKE